jgi:hypothetical protein
MTRISEILKIEAPGYALCQRILKDNTDSKITESDDRYELNLKLSNHNVILEGSKYGNIVKVDYGNNMDEQGIYEVRSYIRKYGQSDFIR